MIKFERIISVLANGTSADSGKSNSGSVVSWLEDKLLPFIATVGDMLMNAIMTFFIYVVQFMLRIVDFFQFFVGKLAGIDTWSSKGDVGSVRLADTDVIFRFLLSDTVLKAFIAIVGIAIVLLIIFTIMAIVKADYNAATTDEEAKKGKILKKTGQALFVMLIVPFVLIFGILGSNAVLASLSNTIKPNSTISLGGQIFSASSYEANRYRQYAENNLRIPVSFGDEILDVVYVPEKGEFAFGGLVTINETPIFVAPRGMRSDGNLFYCSAYEYKDGGYVKQEEELVFEAYENNKGSSIKDWPENTVALPDLTVDGRQVTYNANTLGVYPLGYIGIDDATQIINGVYNSWNYNESLFSEKRLLSKNYLKFDFESTYIAKPHEVGVMSNVNRTDLYKFSNNSGIYFYDKNFVPIKDEYYVMADFIDYAVDHSIQFYFVNASNKQIDWGDVNDFYKTTETDGAMNGFIVEYDSGINRYYEFMDSATNELDGETFIVCSKVGDKYVPITQANNRSEGFVSSYLAEEYDGPIVARGVFDDKGNPTIISIQSNEDQNDIAYYKICGTGGVIANNEDKINGVYNVYQKAEGEITAYNTAGKKLENKISFSYVKVDEIYVENNVQYIKLHFYSYKGQGDPQTSSEDADFNYLFSATVLGTKENNDQFVSNLFGVSTIFTVNGVSYSALPSEEVLKNTIQYIYFNREDIKSNLEFDFAIGFWPQKIEVNNSSVSNGYYARFKLGMTYNKNDNSVYYLTNGSAVLDYNFNKTTGIELKNLYRPGDLNIIILLFATVLIFTVLTQAVWGLIARIFEITIMFILYPGFAATIPYDDGSRFKTWRGDVVKKVLGAYGVILGINLFFVLLPVVRDATYIFREEDIPAALAGRSIFGNADFLNRIVYIMFLLVLFTMIRTLPKLVADLIGAEEVFGKGGDVRDKVKGTVARVGDVVSGKAIKDYKDNALKLAGSFIPGKAIVSPLVSKLKDAAVTKHAERKEKKEEAEEEKEKIDTRAEERKGEVELKYGTMDEIFEEDGSIREKDKDGNPVERSKIIDAFNEMAENLKMSVKDDGSYEILDKDGRKVEAKDAKIMLENAKDEEIRNIEADRRTETVKVYADYGVSGSGEFRSELRRLRKEDPEEWARVRAFDRSERYANRKANANILQKALMLFGQGDLVSSYKENKIQKYFDKMKRKYETKATNRIIRRTRRNDLKDSIIKSVDKKIDLIANTRIAKAIGEKVNNAVNSLKAKYSNLKAKVEKFERKPVVKAGKAIIKGIYSGITMPFTVARTYRKNKETVETRVETARESFFNKNFAKGSFRAATDVSDATLAQITGKTIRELRKLMKAGLLERTFGNETAEDIKKRLENLTLRGRLKTRLGIFKAGKEAKRKAKDESMRAGVSKEEAKKMSKEAVHKAKMQAVEESHAANVPDATLTQITGKTIRELRKLMRAGLLERTFGTETADDIKKRLENLTLKGRLKTRFGRFKARTEAKRKAKAESMRAGVSKEEAKKMAKEAAHKARMQAVEESHADAKRLDAVARERLKREKRKLEKSIGKLSSEITGYKSEIDSLTDDLKKANEELARQSEMETRVSGVDVVVDGLKEEIKRIKNKIKEQKKLLYESERKNKEARKQVNRITRETYRMGIKPFDSHELDEDDSISETDDGDDSE